MKILRSLGAAVFEAQTLVSWLGTIGPTSSASTSEHDPLLWLASAVYGIGHATLCGMALALGGDETVVDREPTCSVSELVCGVRYQVTENAESAIRSVGYGTLLELIGTGGVERVCVRGESGFGDGICGTIEWGIRSGRIRSGVDVSWSSLSVNGLESLVVSLCENETCLLTGHGLMSGVELGGRVESLERRA